MLKTENDERAKHSFKPRLETATRAESKLRITSEPASYAPGVPFFWGVFRRGAAL